MKNLNYTDLRKMLSLDDAVVVSKTGVKVRGFVASAEPGCWNDPTKPEINIVTDDGRFIVAHPDEIDHFEVND